jgi:hypothetical protein
MREIGYPLLLGLLAALVMGCNSYPEVSQVDEHWGNAKRENAERMVVNPRAAETTEPATGTDGVTAEAIMENYRKGQAEREAFKQQPSIINIGGR